MADVFISYKREEIDWARRVARALEAEGYSAFFDAHDDNGLNVGETWDQRLERELAGASAVVVLWSTKSVSSQNVRDEARRAAARGVLVPALLEKCEPPLGLGTLQFSNIEGWNGDLSDKNWRRLVDSGVARLVRGGMQDGQSTVPGQSSQSPNTMGARLARRSLFAAAGMAAIGATGYFGYQAYQQSRPKRVALVTDATLSAVIIAYQLEFHGLLERKLSSAVDVVEERQLRGAIQMSMNPALDEAGLAQVEPLRVCRRLHSLRGWSHEQEAEDPAEVFAGGA